jgi:hypothetical protein
VAVLVGMETPMEPNLRPYHLFKNQLVPHLMIFGRKKGEYPIKKQTRRNTGPSKPLPFSSHFLQIFPRLRLQRQNLPNPTLQIPSIDSKLTGYKPLHARLGSSINNLYLFAEGGRSYGGDDGVLAFKGFCQRFGRSKVCLMDANARGKGMGRGEAGEGCYGKIGADERGDDGGA